MAEHLASAVVRVAVENTSVFVADVKLLFSPASVVGILLIVIPRLGIAKDVVVALAGVVLLAI